MEEEIGGKGMCPYCEAGCSQLVAGGITVVKLTEHMLGRPITEDDAGTIVIATTRHESLWEMDEEDWRGFMEIAKALEEKHGKMIGEIVIPINTIEDSRHFHAFFNIFIKRESSS